MEMHQLEYLVAVVEEGGFTAAATRLHVSQPGVSSQVRKLEQELGVPLLERRTRAVVLTEAGRAVLPHARAALAARRAVREVVTELTGLLRGRVRVGHVSSGASGTTGALLAAFHTRHPQVEITLVEGDSGDLCREVREGRLDLAWVSLADDRPEGLSGQVLSTSVLVAAVAPDHALAARSRVRVADLAGHPVVALPRGTGARTALDGAAATAGVQLTVAFEAGSPELLGELTRRGLGVAVVVEELAHALGLIAVRLTAPTARSRLELVWREGGPASPAGRALLADAREGVSLSRGPADAGPPAAGPGRP